MLETVTITEYTIMVTTRSKQEAEQVRLFHQYSNLKYIQEERTIHLCSICYSDIIYVYCSYGPVTICNNCKTNDIDKYPKCTICYTNPKEPISSSGLCWLCLQLEFDNIPIE